MNTTTCIATESVTHARQPHLAAIGVDPCLRETLEKIMLKLGGVVSFHKADDVDPEKIIADAALVQQDFGGSYTGAPLASALHEESGIPCALIRNSDISGAMQAELRARDIAIISDGGDISEHAIDPATIDHAELTRAVRELFRAKAARVSTLH